MERLLRDLRYALRTLGRSLGFTAVAVLTLGLGIGATTAVVSVVNAVFLEGLPYPDAERLVLIEGVMRDEEDDGEPLPISYLDFMDFQARTTPGGADLGSRPPSFGRLALYTTSHSFNLTADGEPERLSGEMVTSSYFDLLGAVPAQGRFFRPEEDRHPAGERLVILSAALWQRRFGDAVLADQTLPLNGHDYRVIGVAPPGFAGLTDEAQLWVPVVEAAREIATFYIEVRSVRWLSVIGSLAPGVDLETAQSALRGVTVDLAEQYPPSDADTSVRLTTLAESWFGDLRGSLLALLGGAALVLLMACVNVANLLLARAAVRQREMAVRLANGASRSGLVRQLLVESFLLAVGGLALGLLLSRWVTHLLVATSAVDFQSFLSFRTDATVLGVAVLATLLAVLVFGLAPAVLASRAQLAEVLKDSAASAGGGRGRQRLQRSLVVVEVAVAVVLLVGTGLLLDRFRDLRSTELGFAAENLLTLRASLFGPAYAGTPAKTQLGQQFLDRLSAMPGVESFSLVGPGMPTDDWYGSYFTIEDRVRQGAEDMLIGNFYSVTPGAFRTLGVPLLSGRDFTRDDNLDASQVIVVAEDAIDYYWAGEDPLGKRIKFGPRGGQAPWMTVVGTVGSVRQEGVVGEETTHPDIYFSFYQYPPSSPPVFNFLLRPVAGAQATALVPAVREVIRDIAPQLPVYDVATMEQRLGEQLARDRFLLQLAAVFGLLALTIAAIGIYGVLAFMVAEQRREIAIRMSLGAGRGTVIARVLRQGMMLTAVGLALGVGASFVLLRLAGGLIPDLELGQPLVYLSAALVLLVVALVASYLPALRAARVEPMVTLRSE